MGHPLGCSGNRLVVTLCHYLKTSGKRYGVVSLCIGTGMGAAAVFENLDAIDATNETKQNNDIIVRNTVNSISCKSKL